MTKTIKFMNPATLSPVSICRRSLSCCLTEDGTEIGDIVDSDTRGNLSDGEIRLDQLLFCHGHPDLQDVLRGGISGHSLDLSVKLGLAHKECRRQLIVIQFSIRYMLVNY